ncbi:hypothetical protein GCM10012288_22550 [Malaciobacter pacificus]|uniref:Uncharacterized protein n=1 Tax=Malaciobacter pacificus TaxID=1080223 RepID=A0A5C2HD12_9BACT|nr:hypothetical protein [Malaciobacter pacificus]QEP35016.1 hypothetical protein APAC_1942 [Malaciobacter pacificus]GGD47817.1 hypothetical protein GCM10012288_22550 [Malaciobacter pacificus]
MRTLQLKTKIQLFILPLLLIYLFFNLYENYFKNEKSFPNKNINYESKEKSFKGSFIEIYSKIETFSKSKKIKVLNISESKKVVKLLIESNLSNSVKLLDYIENINSFSKIIKINLIKKEKQIYIYEIEVSFGKYYTKNLKSVDFKLTDKNPKFKLNAIIGDYVLINNKIITLNEKVDGYILNKVSNNYAILAKDKELIKLEFKNEKIK